MKRILLSQLQAGNRVVLDDMQICGVYRRRLRDLGFLPGREITCLFRAPCGSPIGLQLNESVFALREKDCNLISGFIDV